MNQTKNGPRRQQFKYNKAPGHYEKKHPFILYKFDALQSRPVNLKSVENFKKEFKRHSIAIKK